MQLNKKLNRKKVVRTNPSFSKKKAYNTRDKRTRAIFIQFISPVFRTDSSELRTESARTMSDKITRNTPAQKKIKPAPGSVTLPKPSRVAP